MDILAAMDTSKQDTSSGIFVIDRTHFLGCQTRKSVSRPQQCFSSSAEAPHAEASRWHFIEILHKKPPPVRNKLVLLLCTLSVFHCLALHIFDSFFIAQCFLKSKILLEQELNLFEWKA